MSCTRYWCENLQVHSTLKQEGWIFMIVIRRNIISAQSMEDVSEGYVPRRRGSRSNQGRMETRRIYVSGISQRGLS